jgi:hypothetical protein
MKGPPTNFVVNASRSGLGITSAPGKKTGHFLPSGKGINGYLDRPTEVAATVVRLKQALEAEAATASRAWRP